MKLFVFDLDFTLWNAGDTFCSETQPPYRWRGDKLIDEHERWIRLYPDTTNVLAQLSADNKLIAAASRTHQPLWANDLLQLFKIDRYFACKEIYAGNKITHLKNIHEFFKVPYNQMVFFDDEQRNIDDVATLGVHCVLISNGIKLDDIQMFIR